MKKKVFMFLFILCFTFSNIVTYAHKGRTDSNGGHYDRSTGEYHYHHGYPAHQHINGVCPYTSNITTSSSTSSTSSLSFSTSNSKSANNSEKKSTKVSTETIITIIVICTLYVLPLLVGFIRFLIEKIQDKYRNIYNKEKKIK